MKPTHIALEKPNAPAVIFRPTFHVTGTMLQSAIILAISDQEPKITIDTVKANVHRLLQRYGNFQDVQLQDDLPQLPEGWEARAEALTQTMFPEFFGKTPDQAQKEYGSFLASLPPIVADKGAKGANDTTDKAGFLKVRNGSKNARTLTEEIKLPEPEPERPMQTLSDVAGSFMNPGEPLTDALRDRFKDAAKESADKERTATEEVTKAAAQPKAAPAKKATAAAKKAPAPKTTTPPKKGSMRDFLHSAEKGLEVALGNENPKKAAVQAKADKTTPAKKVATKKAK